MVCLGNMYMDTMHKGDYDDDDNNNNNNNTVRTVDCRQSFPESTAAGEQS